jgi:hypothetical protein
MHVRNPVTIVGAIKKHHNTRTRPEEVEEEPMVTVRAQEQQRHFLVPYYLFVARSNKVRVAKKRPTEISSPLSFLFFFLQTKIDQRKVAMN